MTFPTLLRPLLASALGLLFLLSGCITEDDEPGIGDTIWDFAYVSLNPPTPGSQRIHLATLDGEEMQITFESSQVADTSPIFSPDGSHVVFNRADDAFVIDMASGDETRLTEFDNEEDCRVVARDWNASSDSIAFRCSGDESFIGVATLDGTVSQPSSDVEHLDAVFLPNGDVLTLAVDDDNIRHLRRYNSALTTGSTIATFDDRTLQDLSVSPDGAWATLIEDVDPDTEATNRNDAILLLIDIESGAVTEHLDSGPHGVHSWHPDSERVLLSTGGWGNPAGRLFFLDVTDGSETEIADTSIISNGSIDDADVSPDGEWIIFADSNAEDLTWNSSSIHVIGTDGEDHRRLTDLSISDRAAMPSFNPAAF